MGRIATFRFYAELNDFLEPARRYSKFEHDLSIGSTVKDSIEALGVPHTEVDLVLVNGESVAFAQLLQAGDKVSVFPVFESLDVGSIQKVRAEPLRETRFVVDANLGRLARYLRLLGFDTAYVSNATNEELAESSLREHRVLLTKDAGLLQRRSITHGYFVRATDPREQVTEVIRRFDLFSSIDRR